MSTDRQEMRNDALSRLGLPTIPVHQTPQVTAWNDDESTLVTSASLSMSSLSSDTLVSDSDSDSDSEGFFQDRQINDFLDYHFGSYDETVNRLSRNISRFLDAIAEFGSDDFYAELQRLRPPESQTPDPGSIASGVYSWIQSRMN
ncbi:uncharacterized protein Triagg1_9215 [Trichoderma aggressivum f. europaeum]|uniref:Uncharacterized protein n=1 Tax=Trichoderma aggressivum f. europaeum TaxID=173218 RepID=A0AAE1IAV2_9HYPO|nr:hypothetical protein Triagg1_9215 [Trichoderma aggressivum f. europaeum]